MHSKRWFSTIVLAGFVGLLLAACGTLKPSDSSAVELAVNELTPAAELIPPATSLPVVAPPPPAALPASTPQPSTGEPAEFPTPEPWQPAPVELTTAEASPPDASAPETIVEPVAASAVDNQGTAPPASYELGVCFADLPGQDAGPAVVACDQPHRVEVYHVGVFTDPPTSPHPGEALLTRGLEQCAPSFEALPGVAQSGESFEALVHAPSPRQWESGERFLACILVFPDDVDQPLTEIDRSVAPATLGACFSGADVNSLSPVSCQEPHRFQVYATTGVLDIEAAEDFCRRALGDEALFVDFNNVWQADVIVGDNHVDCYLSSPEPATGSVFIDSEG